MPAIVSLLRAVNLGNHNKIGMGELRALYVSLGFRDARTFIASGNVVFTSQAKAVGALSKRIEDAIEKRFGIRPEVVVRTSSELRDAIAKNPFAKRPGLEPRRLLIDFLVREPDAEAVAKTHKLKTSPDELRVVGRELYMYFANGMGRPVISWGAVEKILGTPGTGRNLNTARKLLEMAEALEAAH